MSLHIDKSVNELIDKDNTLSNNYQMALYMFSYASFLEFLLLENYDKEYSDSVIKKVNDYQKLYHNYIDDVTAKIVKESKSLVQTTALKCLSKVSGGAGKVVEKIPLISRSQLDENLIKVGSSLSNKKEIKPILQLQKY